MLFNYLYVNHSIEKFQDYLDHLVKEVWCKATGDFSIDLLHPELKLIVEAVFNDESITTDPLDGPIRRIYELFKTQLNGAQRQQISDWYDHNNDIEALCACDLNKLPATYADIRNINKNLEQELKEFCKGLFTSVIHLKAVTSRIGEIEAHYKTFVAVNRKDKCPYCGYGDIKGIHRNKREAYDHFLPKGIYPFNSINFRNLAPMCNECNSTYKLAKDPTRHIDPISRKAGGRRKAFYSYSAIPSGIVVSASVKNNDVSNLQPNDIDLQLTAPGREEEVEAWKEIFGIEERYKAKLCAENDGKAWLQQIVEDGENVGWSCEERLNYELRLAERFPYDGARFLKKPFLEACLNAGIIRREQSNTASQQQ